MDKTQLKRHDLVFISQAGKDKIWEELSDQYQGRELSMVRDVLLGANDIPGFVRRSDERPEEVALGFVHPQRINGNRIRIAAFTGVENVEIIMTPYEVMQRKVFTIKGATRCIETIIALYALADEFDLQIGVLGSAALELATGLPYTDEGSDVDVLLKPAPYNRLLDFYRTAKENFSDIPLDFELDLPNGYGVKLAEVFMDTKTLLGKSLDSVNILYRKDIIQYLV